MRRLSGIYYPKETPMFKMANIPVYTASDTSSGNRACAMLAELLGFITLAIVWFTVGKKSRFIGEHCRFALKIKIALAAALALCTVAGTLLIWTVIAPIIFTALGALCVACVTALDIFMAVRAAHGRFASKKRTRSDARDYALLGDEVALEAVKTNPEYADILAEYERIFAPDDPSDDTFGG